MCVYIFAFFHFMNIYIQGVKKTLFIYKNAYVLCACVSIFYAYILTEVGDVVTRRYLYRRT